MSPKSQLQRPSSDRVGMDDSLVVEVAHSLRDLGREQWNALLHDGNPFLRHEFLSSLETSGSASQTTGWTPMHLLLKDGRRIEAALPLYLKDHSWGEFVFDQPWAQAYRQAGLAYYPRLVTGVPFTPVTGNRVLCRDQQRHPDHARRLLDEARRIARQQSASSIHVLFPSEGDLDACRDNDFLRRSDCQFHWHNRNYGSFEDFLSGFTASRRKKVRRERRKVSEAGFRFRAIDGGSLTEPELDTIYDLHASTFAVRGQAPYLTKEFFAALIDSMPGAMVFLVALIDDEIKACAICLRDDRCLYGRYWGAAEYHDSLHFETCYYQGIEYCIQKGLVRFEPGAQGEHKLARGFDPVATHSCHWLANDVFSNAIGRHLEREREWVDLYIEQARNKLPFRKTRGEAAPE